MADWVLIPSLVALRAAFNALNPARDKASDGSIGDPAHANSSSDHNPDETGNVPIRDADSRNEVHAVDVDETGPWPRDARGAFTMMRAVRQIITDCRAGREKRLRYVIYERTIWSESWNWAARDYTGANPHDKHAHFSGSYATSREADDGPWNIGWVEDTVSKADVLDALDDAVPWQSAGIGRQATDAGMGNKSLRALVEYIYAAVAFNREAELRRVIAEVVAADDNDVVLTDGQMELLAQRMATALPTPAQIAEAVNDDAATRLAQ